MSESEFKKFESWIKGLIIAFLCQAVIIGFAAGGVWVQVYQHEEWKNQTAPQIAILWNDYSIRRSVAKKEQKRLEEYNQF